MWYVLFTVFLFCSCCFCADKENLDRSDASINLGFESPTVKLVSAWSACLNNIAILQVV